MNGPVKQSSYVNPFTLSTLSQTNSTPADSLAVAPGRPSNASANSFKGDRFIPFRGTSDNFFMEEYMLNNEDPFADAKRKKKLPPRAPEIVVEGLTSTPSPTEVPALTAEGGSSGASSIQYSLGSGHKKKQSFQELITESLFTHKRGSPNTLTLQEAEEEELRFSRLPSDRRPSNGQQ